jgi:hypothetical protein
MKTKFNVLRKQNTFKENSAEFSSRKDVKTSSDVKIQESNLVSRD